MAEDRQELMRLLLVGAGPISYGHDPRRVVRHAEHIANILEGRPSWTPTIVCLCGSSRFYDAFQRAYYDETMAGRIVLSVGFRPDAAPDQHGEGVGCTPEQKLALDELHLRKVELADEVLVLNAGGYVGSSTRGEVEHARRLGKRVRWLEPDKIPDDLKEAG